LGVIRLRALGWKRIGRGSRWHPFIGLAAVTGFLGLAPMVTSGASGGDLTIVHAAVIDIEHGTVKRNCTVEIRGGMIETIAPTVSGHGSGPSLDASGKYLIPGLWDMHVHRVNAAPIESRPAFSRHTSLMASPASVPAWIFDQIIAAELVHLSERALPLNDLWLPACFQISNSIALHYGRGPALIRVPSLIDQVGANGLNVGTIQRVVETAHASWQISAV
jgi:hypothetical protein